MDELALALQELQAILKPGLTPKRLTGALVNLLERAEQAGRASRDRALVELAGTVATAPLGPASFLALGCGALIEQGADPHAALAPVTARAREALTGAAAFVEACQARARAAPPGGPDPEDADLCVKAFGEQVSRQFPEQSDAWLSTPPLLQALTAVLQRSAQARRAAAADGALVAALERLLERTDPGLGDYVRKLIRVLEGEELVVLYPALGRGYRIWISGIADNFQLHVLLADALIGDPARGWLPGARPHPDVVAAFKDGPVTSSLPPAQGSFNLWNWQGLLPDGTLPQGTEGSEHWIWNEGVPADIARFEGTRVILLGPLPYLRSWTAGRLFPGMAGELRVLEILPPAAARAWLQRLAGAAGRR